MWLIPYALEHPWAITPEMLPVVAEVLARHAVGEGLTAADLEARLGDRRPAPELRRTGSVAVVPLAGLIVPRANLLTDVSGASSAERFGAQMDELAADEDVSSIVIDANTTGGQVAGIPEAFARVLAARKQKPVVAVVNHVAASAGYWLVSAASEIVATPSAQLGAIGVYTMHRDLSKALEMRGEKVTIISAGKHKVEATDIAPLSTEAHAAIKAKVDEMYAMFTRDVAKGRGVAPAAVRGGFGEGRTVGAADAVRLGMADREGTLDGVIRQLAAGKWRAPEREAAPVATDTADESLAAAVPPATVVADEGDLDRRRRRLRAALQER